MATWRDWKGDLVSDVNQPSDIVSVSIPPEMASKATLLAYLGVSHAELKKIRYFRNRMYENFDVPNRRGKTRKISAPDKRLKFIQRKLCVLFDRLYRRRNPVHGFVEGRSVKSNALSHINSKSVLNIDLKDFFPSIAENRVRGMLSAIGINHSVATIISRICCNDGKLPQGAPSSPVISNMICFKLDKQLLTLAKETHSIYTRYADDITFSSYQPQSSLFEGGIPSPGIITPDSLAGKLRRVFEANGFEINPDKLHYADKHSRRIVTGLKINESLNVDRTYVRNIRAALYSVEKNGVTAAEAILKGKYGSKSSISEHLNGKINWLGYVKGRSDPVFRGIADRFNKSFPKLPIKIEPTAAEIRDRSTWIVEDLAGGVSQGTAFFLKDVGLVTAAHCVQDLSDIVVYHPANASNKFKVQVSKICKHRDLAILTHHIASNEFYHLARSAKAVDLGDIVTAIGYPGFGAGDRINVRSGTVSSLPMKSAVQMIEVTQQLADGMSGGPLVDHSQAVVGIIHKGGPDEGRDFAIHIKVLNEWISSSA
jgi:S1-C subfamily serine protease